MKLIPKKECLACQGTGVPKVYLIGRKVFDVTVYMCTDKLMCPCVVAKEPLDSHVA